MTFAESCRDIAQRFVQTVVIVDDQAFSLPAETPNKQAVTPSIRGLAGLIHEGSFLRPASVA
jgi:hypothetical protein